MSELSGWDKTKNLARDAFYYTKALTNVLPGQVWRNPDSALEGSLVNAYGNSVRRGDGENIKYPDWAGDPTGKRIIGQANVHTKDDGKTLVVNDVYDFYDGDVSQKYDNENKARVQKAIDDRNYDYLAQTAATNIYKKKQQLMPWANPRIEYEIPLSAKDTSAILPTDAEPRQGFGSRAMDALNGFLAKDVSPDGGSAAPSAPSAPPSAPSVYTVQSGDNLTAIAAKQGMTPEELAKINGIKNMNLINVGQSLRFR